RDDLQQYLEQHKVQTLIHYPIPPHQQQAYAMIKSLNLPLTERTHNEVLSLPMSPVLSYQSTKCVVEAVNHWRSDRI
ncbi:aminotransferase, partial [Salinivibrio sp. VYel6]|uniref:DegT/DnrJ/EryC1/StrS family aminotransferase n=1 Tax=Salinivibrio sp. VYel6 TaxID=2490493 RepID=UPI001562E580|nr:aminotransferase [Salinivibrio sp. VYel6]